MAPGAASSNTEGNATSDLLLDFHVHSPGHCNTSTAVSRTSTGLPVLSHFSVRCPGLQLQESATSPLTPKAIAADADLVLLRVPIDPMANCSDYFVYRAHPQHPEPDLLPTPSHHCLGDNEIAILSCADGKQFAVAALQIKPLSMTTFTLHLYRSRPDGYRGDWTVQQVSVEDPLRDRVCPVPCTAERLMYHLTTKVITLGGAKGTVGWVDLWRGILLYDVLDPSPKLRDMPLPLPSRGNWGCFLNSCEEYYRDITVSQDKSTIKYVEMEISLHPH